MPALAEYPRANPRDARALGPAVDWAESGWPEPLKENLSGFWSRRIDDTNRLVYAVDEQMPTVISCRYHF